MKDKLENNNAYSDNLFFADLNIYNELIEEVKPNIFNFIFIDSLDNMHIGAHELKEIRKNYEYSANISM